jgi:hypothetical protein
VRKIPTLVLSALVALAGCGDEDLGQIVTPVTQVHHQGGGAVDLLFVVDSSFSMFEEQTALGDGFDQFISSFQRLQYDFRIAVTTTDVINDAGAFEGPVLTPDTPGLRRDFAEQVNVGTDGFGVEQGLQAARLALSDENIGDQDFLREGATLAIIFVSDEDDSSISPVEAYYDFFLDKKGGDARRLRVSAITGPDRGGCNTAAPGRRYLQLVEQTDGHFESICQNDLGLSSLGLALSGFKSEFELVNIVEEGEPRVFVNGVELEDGFEFSGQSVRFADGQAPDDCSVVEIAYFTRDYVDTAGEPVLLEPEPAICRALNIDRPGIVLEREGCTQGPGPIPWLAIFGLLLFASGRKPGWR